MAFQPQPFGKYYLLERVATGGMAEIYKAKTFGVVGFEKLLAIKRILPHLSQNADFIRMLIDEAKIAVQLNHMNIVQVFDLGKIGSDYFIAMEYIHGKDLRTIYKSCEETKYRISVENAVYIVVEICKGLDYAHRKKDQFGLPSGIVHRDISPQNILISFEGEVKIVDFGIAKAQRKATETDAGVLKGKFSYMSPEQARGEEVDQRTDIFSTGIILYELLTGSRLFYSENNLQTLEKIRKFHIAPPFLPPDVPSELEFILMQALQNNPDDRYQTANDFQVDLTKFLYSSALDFTSKNLTDLMIRLFKDDIQFKKEKEKALEHVQLDTQTRFLIQKANQEVLVTRGEELTPSGVGAQMVASQKSSPSTERKVFRPADLFEHSQIPKEKRKIFVYVVAVLLALGIFYFRNDIWTPVRKIFAPFLNRSVQAPTAENNRSRRLLPGKEASLIVETDPPGARVYLDGKEMTTLSPMRIKPVEPRTEHLLLLSLQNYKQEQKKLVLEPGEVKKIKVDLSHEIGNLFLGSTPTAADIYINDELHGQTPKDLENVFANVDLPVKIRKPGYYDFFEVVRLQPGQTKILQAKLRKIEGAFGSLQISSVPSGAKIVLNGEERRERTPTMIDKLATDREHFLVLHLDGYQDYESKIRVSDGNITPIKAYLKNKPEEIH